MRCSSLCPPLHNTSAPGAHLGSPNPLCTSITWIDWTAGQTAGATAVAKMLALNHDKGDNSTVYFHIYIEKQRDTCPQSLMKCIEFDTYTAISV